MPRNRPLRWLLSLGVFACQPAGNGSSEADNSALLARLDQIDERLTAIEAKFDTAATTLEVVASWTTAQVEEDQRRSSERETKRSEREARHLEREARRRELGLTEDDSSRPSPFEIFKKGSSSREIEGAAEGIQCTESSESHAKCSIDRAFLDHILANPALLAKQARVVPSQRDGATVGFKLYGIRRGSLPKLLLIKNGDLIKTINDDELDSIDQAMAVYTKLRRSTHFDVEIERKGMSFALEIEII